MDRQPNDGGSVTGPARAKAMEKAQRARIHTWHTNLDDAAHEAVGIADMFPDTDIPAACQRIHQAIDNLRHAHAEGYTNAAVRHAVEAAADALGIAATLTTRKDPRHG